MQPHEQHDPKPDPPKPKEPDPGDERAKWLLFAIAILLGLIASQIAKHFTRAAAATTHDRRAGHPPQSHLTSRPAP
jgi:hypothetical protein